MRATAWAVVLALASGTAAAADSPAAVFAEHCAHCHAAGIAGAPRVDDQAEWSRRVRPGMTLLYRSALEGMPNTAMMAKGGHRELSDETVKATVDFMVAAAKVAAGVLKSAARYEALGITNRDFIRLDRSFDGYLSRAEVSHDADLLAGYSRFDGNRDGRLSEAEYLKAEATLARERAAVDVGDATLVAQVKKALAGVKGLNADGLKVESANGALTMAGIVEDAESARQAQDRVKRIKGIKSIDNRLVSAHIFAWD